MTDLLCNKELGLKLRDVSVAYSFRSDRGVWYIRIDHGLWIQRSRFDASLLTPRSNPELFHQLEYEGLEKTNLDDY